MVSQSNHLSGQEMALPTRIENTKGEGKDPEALPGRLLCSGAIGAKLECTMMNCRHESTRPDRKIWITVRLALVAAALALVIAGCGRDSSDVVEPTRAPAAQPAPSPTFTAVPPPTPTQAPADTPVSVPTHTPSPTAPPADAPPGEVRSDKERATNLAVPGPDLDTLVEGNSAFAFDLYHAIGEQDGNLFYSPYSISVALAMTYAGAGGETERQMADALRFRLPQDRLHPALNALDQELASRGKDGEGFTLNIANAIWGQEGYEFIADFLDVLALNYGAGMRLVNFVKAAEESRETINNWVAERTEDRIIDLIPPDGVSGLTRLVLTNAIYFKAAWATPFLDGATRPGAFHLLDGEVTQTPMMTQTSHFGYARGDGYEAIDLPYKGEQMSMTILMPDKGEFDSFEAAMDANYVGGILKNLQGERLDLTMPLFKFESQISLNKALVAMGMPDAFDGAMADFSGMNGLKCESDPLCLLITDVFHKAFVAVDEEGTEAAAATGVVVGIESAPPQVVIDRPFIFVIRDVETGAILFVGRVIDPRG